MVGDRVAGCVVLVEFVHDAGPSLSANVEGRCWIVNGSFIFELRHHFSSIFGRCANKPHSFGSDADSDNSSGDWGHNIWNHLLDMLAEYQTGPVLLRFLQDEEAGRVRITSHFALDVMSHAMGQQRRDLRWGKACVNGEFKGELGGASRGTGAKTVAVGRI